MNLTMEELTRRLARLMSRNGRLEKAQRIEAEQGFEAAEAYLQAAREAQRRQ